MTRSALLATVLLAAEMGAIPSARAEDVPSRSKTMTSDPATNHALVRYTRPLPDPAQAAIRTIMLFRLLSVGCIDIVSDKRKLDTFAKASGVLSLPAESARTASRFAAAEFDAFDYDALTHLCVGSDYLFGPRGVLIKGAMSKGSGRVRFAYDPANPYIPVRPFLPE